MELAASIAFVALCGWQFGEMIIEWRAEHYRFAGLHGALAAWSALNATLSALGMYS